MEELFYKIQDFAIRYSELIALVGVIATCIATVTLFKPLRDKFLNMIKRNSGVVSQAGGDINIETINNAGRDIHVREKLKSKNRG